MTVKKDKCKPKKGMVFCHTCNQIVGDSFPVDHHHKNWGNSSGVVYMIKNEMYGFSYYIDNKKNRKWLAKNKPPRTKIEVEI